MYTDVCSETAGVAHGGRGSLSALGSSPLGRVLIKHCLCIATVSSVAACPAAVILQRTADTAAPGSYSSRHTGSLPAQCVRPPSGQGENKDAQLIRVLA